MSFVETLPKVLERIVLEYFIAPQRTDLSIRWKGASFTWFELEEMGHVSFDTSSTIHLVYLNHLWNIRTEIKTRRVTLWRHVFHWFCHNVLCTRTFRRHMLLVENWFRSHDLESSWSLTLHSARLSEFASPEDYAWLVSKIIARLRSLHGTIDTELHLFYGRHWGAEEHLFQHVWHRALRVHNFPLLREMMKLEGFHADIHNRLLYRRLCQALIPRTTCQELLEIFQPLLKGGVTLEKGTLYFDSTETKREFFRLTKHHGHLRHAMRVIYFKATF